MTSFELHGDSDRFIFFAIMQWGLIKCRQTCIEDKHL